MLRFISQMQATLGCVRQYKKAPAEVYPAAGAFMCKRADLFSHIVFMLVIQVIPSHFPERHQQ